MISADVNRSLKRRDRETDEELESKCMRLGGYTPLENLCGDVLLYMTEWLDHSDLGALSGTCKELNALIAKSLSFIIYNTGGMKERWYIEQESRRVDRENADESWNFKIRYDTVPLWKLALGNPLHDHFFRRCRIPTSDDPLQMWCLVGEVCKNGTVDQLTWVRREYEKTKQEFDVYNGLEKACKWGNLEIAMYLYPLVKNADIDKWDLLFLDVCGKGCLEIAKWMVGKFGWMPFQQNNLKDTIHSIEEWYDDMECDRDECGVEPESDSYLYDEENVEKVVEWIQSLNHLCTCTYHRNSGKDWWRCQ